MVDERIPDYAVNLRRLFAWHLQSNKDVAELIGAAEHSVSGWVTGKREPGAKYQQAIGRIYDINPVRLLGEPKRFGLEISDPDRYDRAEENIAAARRGRLKTV